jgi:membrane-associated phospholipid phosphatase
VAALSYLPPLLIDPMIVAGIDDNNPDVAWQMYVISAQSYAITLTGNAIAKRFFARERPYARSCARNPYYSSSCENADRFRSFYSGHSAVTATSAGLICAHHTHLPLYGGGIYDSATCVAAVTGMLATGALRIVADKHWQSDVFVGHVLGFGVGYLLPTLLYYRGFRAQPDPQSASAPLARSSPVMTASFQF